MFTMLTIEGLCVFTLSKKGEKADFWGRCTHIYVSLDPKVATGSRVQNSCAAICIWCRGGEELPGSVLIERYSNNIHNKGTNTQTHTHKHTHKHKHTATGLCEIAAHSAAGGGEEELAANTHTGSV